MQKCEMQTAIICLYKAEEEKVKEWKKLLKTSIYTAFHKNADICKMGQTEIFQLETLNNSQLDLLKQGDETHRHE